MGGPVSALTNPVSKGPANRRVTQLSGQCLKAAFTLSAACLTLPAAWSPRPSALSRRFPLTRPALFLVIPLADWILCLILLVMLTMFLSEFLHAVQVLNVDALAGAAPFGGAFHSAAVLEAVQYAKKRCGVAHLLG